VTWDFVLGLIVGFGSAALGVKVFTLMLGSHAARAVVDYLLPEVQLHQPPDQDQQ
jgi:hypothetical protein